MQSAVRTCMSGLESGLSVSRDPLQPNAHMSRADARCALLGLLARLCQSPAIACTTPVSALHSLLQRVQRFDTNAAVRI